MGSVRSPREVQGHAVPALQQRRPSGEGLSAREDVERPEELCCVLLSLKFLFSRLLIGLERLTKTRDTQVRRLQTHIVPRSGARRESFVTPFIWAPDKYSSQFGGGSQYAYFHEEDETSFQLVDTAKTQKTAYQRNRMRFAQVRPSTGALSSSQCNVHDLALVPTEEPAEGQGPPEPDSVQHADAAKERQAEGEVRYPEHT